MPGCFDLGFTESTCLVDSFILFMSMSIQIVEAGNKLYSFPHEESVAALFQLRPPRIKYIWEPLFGVLILILVANPALVPTETNVLVHTAFNKGHVNWRFSQEALNALFG